MLFSFGRNTAKTATAAPPGGRGWGGIQCAQNRSDMNMRLWVEILEIRKRAENGVRGFRGVIRRGMDWLVDLLTDCIHYSELQFTDH
jgi:hypothetical protein